MLGGELIQQSDSLNDIQKKYGQVFSWNADTYCLIRKCFPPAIMQHS